MLQTSQDLFFIVASAALVWVAVFLTWALYRFIVMLRQTQELLDRLNEKMAMIDEWVATAKERMAHSLSVLQAIAQSIKTAMAVVKGVGGVARARTKRKKQGSPALNP